MANRRARRNIFTGINIMSTIKPGQWWKRSRICDRVFIRQQQINAKPIIIPRRYFGVCSVVIRFESEIGETDNDSSRAVSAIFEVMHTEGCLATADWLIVNWRVHWRDRAGQFFATDGRLIGERDERCLHHSRLLKERMVAQGYYDLSGSETSNDSVSGFTIYSAK